MPDLERLKIGLGPWNRPLRVGARQLVGRQAPLSGALMDIHHFKNSVEVMRPWCPSSSTIDRMAAPSDHSFQLEKALGVS